MPQSCLYVLYNADGSIMGKLRYSYQKLTYPKDSEQACAACDITHGGLSLKETPSWTAVKAEIESRAGVKVVQWHRDELSPQVRLFVEKENVSYPAVLWENDGKTQVIMDKSDLSQCDGSAELFLAKLEAKGAILDHRANQ